MIATPHCVLDPLVQNLIDNFIFVSALFSDKEGRGIQLVMSFQQHQRCGFSQGKLCELLREAGYGEDPNSPAFKAYFFQGTTNIPRHVKDQGLATVPDDLPRCRNCGRKIDEHADSTKSFQNEHSPEVAREQRGILPRAHQMPPGMLDIWGKVRLPSVKTEVMNELYVLFGERCAVTGVTGPPLRLAHIIPLCCCCDADIMRLLQWSMFDFNSLQNLLVLCEEAKIQFDNLSWCFVPCDPKAALPPTCRACNLPGHYRRNCTAEKGVFFEPLQVKCLVEPVLAEGEPIGGKLVWLPNAVSRRAIFFHAFHAFQRANRLGELPPGEAYGPKRSREELQPQRALIEYVRENQRLFAVSKESE